MDINFEDIDLGDIDEFLENIGDLQDLEMREGDINLQTPLHSPEMDPDRDSGTRDVQSGSIPEELCFPSAVCESTEVSFPSVLCESTMFLNELGTSIHIGKKEGAMEKTWPGPKGTIAVYEPISPPTPEAHCNKGKPQMLLSSTYSEVQEVSMVKNFTNAGGVKLEFINQLFSNELTFETYCSSSYQTYFGKPVWTFRFESGKDNSQPVRLLKLITNGTSDNDGCTYINVFYGAPVISPNNNKFVWSITWRLGSDETLDYLSDLNISLLDRMKPSENEILLLKILARICSDVLQDEQQTAFESTHASITNLLESVNRITWTALKPGDQFRLTDGSQPLLYTAKHLPYDNDRLTAQSTSQARQFNGPIQEICTIFMANIPADQNVLVLPISGEPNISKSFFRKQATTFVTMMEWNYDANGTRSFLSGGSLLPKQVVPNPEMLQIFRLFKRIAMDVLQNNMQ